MFEISSQKMNKFLLLALFLLTAYPGVSAPLALAIGVVYSLLLTNPLPGLTATGSKTLLKLAVVGLGFGVDIGAVIEVGKSSLLLTFASISLTLLLGWLLGQALQLRGNTRALISFGTAICGGSAIAAMAPVIKAKDEEIAVSLAAVFALNAVGLLLFPPLGHLLGLDQQQFGLWAALAIHDTSSVVGAAAAYGAVALTVGTTAKLTRALWIVPCSLAAGVYHKSDKRAGVPLFIIGFILAATLNSALGSFAPLWHGLQGVAKQVLVMTLFLIGTGLTRQTLRQAGPKPLLFAVLLWLCVGSGTLLLLRFFPQLGAGL